MLFTILTFVSGLFSVGKDIVARITQLEEAKVKAKSDKELKQIDADLQEVHDRKAVLLAEASNRITGPLNGFARFALALGPIAILLKYLLWDKVIGSFKGCAQFSPFKDADICYSFATDTLDPNMWWVIIACVSFYFLTSKPRK